MQLDMMNRKFLLAARYSRRIMLYDTLGKEGSSVSGKIAAKRDAGENRSTCLTNSYIYS